jgi:hypothetical protein
MRGALPIVARNGLDQRAETKVLGSSWDRSEMVVLAWIV